MFRAFARLRVFAAVCTGLLTSTPSWAAEPTIPVPTGPDLVVKADWFKPGRCRTSAGPEMNLRVGAAALRAPAASVRRLLPAKFPKLRQAARERLVLDLPASAGCSGTPLQAAMVEFAPTPALPEGLRLLAKQPNAGPSATARGLLNLRDGNACMPASPGLVRCEGTQTVNGTRQPVVYFLASETTKLQVSGAPLHAKCVLAGPDRRLSCGVGDDAADQSYSYETLLPFGEPKLPDIETAHARMRERMAALGVRAN